MPGETVFFVQFPHPGGEHNPRADRMPWNTGDHGRKFLVAPGRYVDSDGRVREGEVVFWGEWEPPSRVERRWPASGQLPRALHRPYWGSPKSSRFRQNTDPWVFGGRMLYSNCRQSTAQGRRSSMQQLTRGSVICFGSTIGGVSCVDTVLVVASAQRWVPASAAGLDVDDAFKTCTAHSIMTKEEDRNLPLSLYRGATFDDPVEGMFSFVPARRADADDPRFARPQVEMPGLINPSNSRAAWGSRRALTVERVREAWESLRDQVLAADLLLAVRFETPQREAGNLAIPTSSRPRC